ncbi:hypothetical protein [Nocardia salmonicida]|uniref:hypothetical protein n=1 Tax=Nocardia salmonicida TaxID=53431 RepID=UPI003CF6A913
MGALLLHMLASDQALTITVPSSGTGHRTQGRTGSARCRAMFAARRSPYSPDLGWAADPRVRAVVEKAVSTLGDLGCRVEEVPVKVTEEVYEAELVKWASLSTALFDKYATPENRSRMCYFTLDMFDLGNARSAADYTSMGIARSRRYDQVHSMLDKYDYLVCPTIAVPLRLPKECPLAQM